MANEVYQRAHNGLTALLPVRAASRVLESAVQSSGRSSDTVDAEVMKRLLLGPVLKELEHILPRDGLKHNLQRLAAALLAVPESTDAAREMPGLVETVAAKRPLARTQDVGVQGLAVQDAAVQDSAIRDVGVPTHPAALSLAIQGAADTTKPSTPVVLSAARLEHMVLAFAQLEHTSFVAAVDAHGKVVAVRGAGVDVASLATFGLTGLKLLGRSGQLRTYYLAHTLGQLFLFPLGQHTLFVVGSADLNVGAVFTTLTTLKEDV